MLHDDRWSDWAQAFQCPLAILRGAQSFENYPSVTPKRNWTFFVENFVCNLILALTLALTLLDLTLTSTLNVTLT